MSLTERQNAIVGALKGENFVTAAELVRVTKGAPFASIRRNIGALRKKGYDIQTSDDRGTSGYRLIGVLPVSNVAVGDAYDTNIDTGDQTDDVDPFDSDDLDDDDIFDDGGW